MHSTHISILQEYGFSEIGAQIYLTLLEIGRGSVESIHRITNIDKTALRATLTTMYTHEYVFCIPKDGIDEYSAITPQELINRKQDACEKLKQLIQQGVVQLDESRDLIDHSTKKNTFAITYYEGVSGLQKYYHQHITEGKTVYGIIAPDTIHPILLDYLHTSHVPERVKHDIYVYALVDRQDSTEKQKYIEANSLSHRETLCIENPVFTISAGINMFGNNAIGIVLYAHDEMCALTLHTHHLYTTLKALFTLLWIQYHQVASDTEISVFSHR